MPTPPEPKREHPSTYYVQNRSNLDEMTRLQLQDQMVTRGMGGVLPEQPDPTAFGRVLDVGCGTGGWLIELAQTTPRCTTLVGIDISLKFVEYARAQAEAKQAGDRVEFHVMDALRVLEFPDASFDLVNHRFAHGWLRTWDWPKLLQEYQRVCKPGGVIRMTESDAVLHSTSPALARLNGITVGASYKAGHSFTPTSDGVTSHLSNLLIWHGAQNVQTRAYQLEYRAGTPEGEHFIENMRLFFRTALPFVRKWTRVPEDYEEIYQQALHEMQQPDFIAPWDLLTAWGNAPSI